LFENNFTRWHIGIAFALWLAFAALTLVIVLNGLDQAAQRPLTVAATVVGSALGPMSGPLCRFVFLPWPSPRLPNWCGCPNSLG
jgi:hypothetical protein